MEARRTGRARRFGFGRFPWQRQPEPADPVEDAGAATDEDKPSPDGAVWVERGVVSVRNPSSRRGRWPSLSCEPDCGLTVLVNGKPKEGTVVLQEGDVVVVQGSTREQPGRIEVTVNDQEVWVQIEPAERVTTTVADAEPAVQLELCPGQRRTPIPHHLTVEDVKRAITAAGVTTDPIVARIAEALANPGSRVLVSQITHEQPSPVVWSVLDRHVRPGEHPYVQTGEPIVEVTQDPPPGAPPDWTVDLVAGPGAMVSADGRVGIAIVGGRPHVVMDGALVVVSVQPELRIDGDVDGTTGDVRFEGHLWVRRDVTADWSIKASGDIEVGGKVVGARVIAGGNLHIRSGATRSLLIAGGPGLAYSDALPWCLELGEKLGQVSEPQTPESTAALFRQVAGLIGRLDSVLNSSEAPLDPGVQRLAKVLQQLQRIFTERAGAGSGQAEAVDSVAVAVADLTAEAARQMRARLQEPGRCFLRYLDNARVEATGDVEILAPGAWRSDIITLGEVRGSSSFRGGSVRARGGVVLGTVGSETGVATRIEVGPEAVFQAADVYPGTTVVRGDATRIFRERTRNVVIGERP